MTTKTTPKKGTKKTLKKPAKQTPTKAPKKITKKPVENPKESSKIIIKCFNWFVYIVCIFFIICYGIIFAFQIAQSNDSTLFGYSLFRVNSGSMEPTLEIGDEIIIKKSNEYHVNDVISYLVDEKNTVTHRIVSIENDIIITKGDANDVTDDPIHLKDVIGKYVGKAKLLDFVLNNKIPILALLGILFVILFILKK